MRILPSAETHPVNDAGRVQMLDAAQHLVQQVGHPFVVQVHLDDLAQVGIHEFHNEVDILELFERTLWCECI